MIGHSSARWKHPQRFAVRRAVRHHRIVSPSLSATRITQPNRSETPEIKDLRSFFDDHKHWCSGHVPMMIRTTYPHFKGRSITDEPREGAATDADFEEKMPVRGPAPHTRTRHWASIQPQGQLRRCPEKPTMPVRFAGNPPAGTYLSFFLRRSITSGRWSLPSVSFRSSPAARSEASVSSDVSRMNARSSSTPPSATTA